MTTLTLYDSVTVDQLPQADYYAAYKDGYYGSNYDTVKSMFPHAHVMSITVTASENADCLDVETGDADPSQIPSWYAAQKANGSERPVIYANASTMKDNVIPVLSSAGISVSDVRLWCAHYEAGEHICGPSSCGDIPVEADGTQWTNTSMGRNLDQSALKSDFFGKVNPPPPPPEPTGNWIMKLIENLPSLKLNDTDASLAHWYIHRLQAVLNAVWGAGLTTDGVYGPSTEAEVKRVQRIYNLSQDGVCGPQVWSVVLAGVVE